MAHWNNLIDSSQLSLESHNEYIATNIDFVHTRPSRRKERRLENVMHALCRSKTLEQQTSYSCIDAVVSGRP